PQQDLRFDVPAVGVDTVRRLHEMGGTVLAVEAGKTILLEKEGLLKEAEVLGVCIVALPDGERCGQCLISQKSPQLLWAWATWENSTQKSMRVRKKQRW